MAEMGAGIGGGRPAALHPPAPPAARSSCYQPLPLRDPQIFDLFGHSGEVRDVRQVHLDLLVIASNESYVGAVPAAWSPTAF